MTLSQEDLDRTRDKHHPGDPFLPGGVYRCIRDGEPWPCDVVKLIEQLAPPMPRNDMQLIRARHAQHTCESHSEPGICSHDRDSWPCDTARLLGIAEAAVNFTVVWQELLPYMPDDYWCTMQCVEAEAAAGLFRAVGDDKTAESVLDAHAAHDTEEDQHYDRGVSVRARREASERGSSGDPVPGS